MSYFISPPPRQIVLALDAWQWLDLAGKRPFRVTAFGDVFLRGDNAIWFLDSLEGKLQHVCQTEAELDRILATEEGQEAYLFTGFVDQAARQGMLLAETECYDFTVAPVLGGPMHSSNVEKRDFAVALNIRGQIHEQVRHHPPGTPIAKIVVADEGAKRVKPWWKLW